MRILVLLSFMLACISKPIHYDQDPIINEVNLRQNNWVAGNNKYFEGKNL